MLFDELSRRHMYAKHQVSDAVVSQLVPGRRCIFWIQGSQRKAVGYVEETARTTDLIS